MKSRKLPTVFQPVKVAFKTVECGVIVLNESALLLSISVHLDKNRIQFISGTM